MKKLTIGILAHVDAGKTTLSEALLYSTGAIRKLGRVDRRDTVLDTDPVERARGITVLSKCARFQTENTEFTLLDTPGHVDFGTEAERVLSVLDLAVLVISGTEGVQSHTKTLWRLLRAYDIPVMIFVNKTDMPGFDKGLILQNIKALFSSSCVDFTHVRLEAVSGGQQITVSAPDNVSEEIAVCEEEMLEKYLEGEGLWFSQIQHAFSHRRLFPVLFGSALRLSGIDELIKLLDILPPVPVYAINAGKTELTQNDFLARCFKISRDETGARLSFVKVLSGTLSPRTSVGEEKISGLRLYSGDKYKTVQEAGTGDIVAITGLNLTAPGMLFGSSGEITDSSAHSPLLEPTVSYRLILPEGTNAAEMLGRLRVLEEEDPTLAIIWDEVHRDILMNVMGTVHIEVLKSRIKERFGLDVSFGSGKIIYKETIKNHAYGAGHFEPLRHYAEVHVLLSEGEPGSGIVVENKCSSDILAGHWQKQIVSVLSSKAHKGVLIGAKLTDVKITLLSGKAHAKHTEGGDFRQAANRAVRQALMKAESVILEPYFRYELSLPADCVGRAMTDLERRGADMELSTGSGVDSADASGNQAVITGLIPAATLGDYRLELASYTRGQGVLNTFPAGYRPCHNPEEVITEYDYDPAADLRNPADSVFCSHGSSFTVPWIEADGYMHIQVDDLGEGFYTDSGLGSIPGSGFGSNRGSGYGDKDSLHSRLDAALGTDDIDEILNRTFYSNSGKSVDTKREKMRATAAEEAMREAERYTLENETTKPYKGREKPYIPEASYLLVDGYNVIFAWPELNELANVNIDGARGRLLDILCDYQAQKGMNLIVVFDAYRVKGHDEEYSDYNNIHVVYTKTAETADRYIERFATDFGRKYHVRVVTSDGVEQVIIRGNGCALTSSREFEDEVKAVQKEISEKIEGRVF